MPWLIACLSPTLNPAFSGIQDDDPIAYVRYDESRSDIKQQGDPRRRVDALRTIALIGEISEYGMKGFIRCFRDNYTQVRREACAVAKVLGLNNNDVIDALIDRFDDPDCEVRSSAIEGKDSLVVSYFKQSHSVKPSREVEIRRKK